MARLTYGGCGRSMVQPDSERQRRPNAAFHDGTIRSGEAFSAILPHQAGELVSRLLLAA